MEVGIYLIQDDGELIELKEHAYDSEDLLQELLARYPDLLAGDQMDAAVPRRWLLVGREAALEREGESTAHWSVDHLFLDQDGVPTLVEVKNGRDRRVRREVVGQMLDYAANAMVHWPVEVIRSQFETSCGLAHQNPETVLAEFLGDAGDIEQFWQEVKTNLQAGRLRLVFVAEEIPAELRRVVEFLNEQMDPAEVRAVEIRQFAGQGLKTLVPRLIGQSAETQRRKRPAVLEKRQWDEAGFLLSLEQARGAEEAQAALRILEWSRQLGLDLKWGQGGKFGSVAPRLTCKGVQHNLFAVWTDGTVELYFRWSANKPPFDCEEKRLDLLNRLNSIEGISLPADVIAGLPNIPLARVRDPQLMRRFLDAFTWVVHEIETC